MLKTLLSAIGLWILTSPLVTWAQEKTETTSSVFTTEGLKDAGVAAGFGNEPQKLAPLVGQLVNAVLAFSGIILVIMFVIGGVYYLTAMGDMERIKKAKGTITNAVIGLVIVVSAYAITTFIFTQLEPTAAVILE